MLSDVLCLLPTQKWREQGRISTAQFESLGCYYGSVRRIDVVGVRLLLQVTRIAGTRKSSQHPIH